MSDWTEYSDWLTEAEKAVVRIEQKDVHVLASSVLVAQVAGYEPLRRQLSVTLNQLRDELKDGIEEDELRSIVDRIDALVARIDAYVDLCRAELDRRLPASNGNGE